MSLLGALTKHRTGAEAAWIWLRENWDALGKGRNTGEIQGSRFITACLDGLATSDHLAEVEDFFSDEVDDVSSGICFALYTLHDLIIYRPPRYFWYKRSIRYGQGRDLSRPTGRSC